MSNHNDETYQDMLKAVRELELLRASNEFKAEVIRQQEGRCLELMHERNALAAALHEWKDSANVVRPHKPPCDCDYCDQWDRQQMLLGCTPTAALRAMLVPTVELLEEFRSLETELRIDTELARLKSLMEGAV